MQCSVVLCICAFPVSLSLSNNSTNNNNNNNNHNIRNQFSLRLDLGTTLPLGCMLLTYVHTHTQPEVLSALSPCGLWCLCCDEKEAKGRSKFCLEGDDWHVKG